MFDNADSALIAQVLVCVFNCFSEAVEGCRVSDGHRGSGADWKQTEVGVVRTVLKLSSA